MILFIVQFIRFDDRKKIYLEIYFCKANDQNDSNWCMLNVRTEENINERMNEPYHYN